MYLDLTSVIDFSTVLDLLVYIRRGIFDLIHIIPPAASWSRSRQSGLPVQSSLRSRSAPLGLSSLALVEDEKVRSANLILELLVWCAEQALQGAFKAVGLKIIFTENLVASWTDLRRSGRYVNFNCWRAVAMLAVLLGIYATSRVQITSVLKDFSTSLHLRSRLSLRWPRLEDQHGKLSYKGPLPISC